MVYNIQGHIQPSWIFPHTYKENLGQGGSKQQWDIFYLLCVDFWFESEDYCYSSDTLQKKKSMYCHYNNDGVQCWHSCPWCRSLKLNSSDNRDQLWAFFAIIGWTMTAAPQCWVLWAFVRWLFWGVQFYFHDAGRKWNGEETVLFVVDCSSAVWVTECSEFWERCV